jgi:hypothetical protein
MPARRARRFALEKTERLVKRVLDTCSCLAAVTLICLALMAFFAPPVVFPAVNYQALVANQSPATATPRPVSQTQQVGTLAVTLQLSPARVGTVNTMAITLRDAQGRAVSDATVRVRIDMQIMNMGEVSATAQGGSSGYRATFSADQTFIMGGTWIVLVEIARPHRPSVSLTFHVLIAE